MQAISDVLSIALMCCGTVFLIVAAIGFTRLPDLFCRLHVTGVIDTLGVPLILLGVAVYIGPNMVAGKLILAILFLYSTSPLVGHLLARAALEARQSKVVPKSENIAKVELDSDELLKKYRYLK